MSRLNPGRAKLETSVFIVSLCSVSSLLVICLQHTFAKSMHQTSTAAIQQWHPQFRKLKCHHDRQKHIQTVRVLTTSVRKHAAKMKNAFTKPEEAVEVRWKTTDTEKENTKNNHERESTQKVACVAQTDCQGSGRAGRTNQDRTCRPRVGAKVTEARGEEATQAWEIQKSSSSSIALRPLQQEGKKVSRHSPLHVHS